ncbi:hypothetical protein CAPTEDRAFT_159256 [Capitella teleta]|uniref:Fibrinogen C-terminal domain-containing protein n=1 Tax=Capitella teleta TaxID=283909 RepID=R7U1Q4_CAPTE|nr:hypothetical protein CAPTEDRAFT_159256 [Capitella teleta]|eukprot:ELT97596.1 hypothetical protein CAPTEDRAFT_159256 [Capitella teleta]
MRVDLREIDREARFARYSTFRVGSEEEQFTLTIDGYSGNAGNAMIAHNSRAFSTKDRDNDAYINRDCANLS